MLPELRQRLEQQKGQRSHYARTATVGDVEEVIERGVEGICRYPRTHHNVSIRTACERLVDDAQDELVSSLSRWVRGSFRESFESLGKAGEMPGEMIAREVRPLVCAHTISACTLSELEILRADETARDEIDEEIDEEIDVEIDEEIDEEIDGEADGEGDGEGDEERRPPVKIESERPIMHQPGPLVRLVAADFHTRVVEEGRESDYLVYFFFPGRTGETDDTHSRLRSTYITLAQMLDAPQSNGSLRIGWMDCAFNGIPPPHGEYITADTIVMYPAGREKKKAPNYLNSLRDGHIDMDELLTFVFQASARAETKIHVASRRSTLGERALREGLQYLTFEESLNVYEPNLEALDLDQIRRSVRGESLGSKGEL